MADCELRDEQFKVIEQQRKYCDEHGIPVFSVDTKKKELLGPYRRDERTAYTTEAVKVYDHDYSTFSNGKMVPYGIYDVKRNTGYMTFGVSHDTAEFACDCFAQQWEQHLRHIYPSAKRYPHPSTEESMRQRQNATRSLKVSVLGISSRTKYCPNGTILSDATDDILYQVIF
jgi:hypothetical protein